MPEAPAAPPAGGHPQEAATPAGWHPLHVHIATCPPGCTEVHAYAVGVEAAAPFAAVYASQRDALAAENERLRQEADGLREQLRLANADWVIAATDRDDYAERLKATDQSWAALAKERDRYRQALDYVRKTAPAPLARVAIAALEAP